MNPLQRTFAAMAFLVSGAICAGAVAPGLDFNASRISDLWEALYPGALIPHEDTDGDGVSNIDERAAGTDPTDASDFLRISGIRRLSERRTPGAEEAAESPRRSANRHARIEWSAVAGKHYTIERMSGADWVAASSITASHSGPMHHDVKLPPAACIVRLRVGDIDADGDGLSGWEEALLGLSDSDARSNGTAGRLDFAAALRLYEGKGSLTLGNGRVIPKRPVPRRDVTRFLAQATFGASPDLIDRVESMGMGHWLDLQLDPPVKTSTSEAMWSNGSTTMDSRLWFRGWWKAVMTGEDQVRQRMAYALSQVFVISAAGLDDLRAPEAQAHFYDLLLKNSLGNFRDLLEDVTYSTQMGQYLSHLQNRKSDPSVSRFPDENFAREIMQLFTIGLWELNLDGSRKLDAQGQAIPTYDNTTIMEMAKVFTGFGYGGDAAWGLVAGVPHVDHVHPMKMWDDEHEPGEKRIVGGVVLPAGQSGRKDVADALDALCEHPNTAPFVSRLLIQRFTSSNPSPAYIRRVATIWQDNGTGVSGDLRAVAEAILLDPEVRYRESQGDASGKVREPYLRLTALLRAFNARVPQKPGIFPVWTGDFPGILGQQPLWAPSVFNFYSPDHRPAGQLRQRGLTAPELEIATADRLLATDNLLQRVIGRGMDPFFNLPEDILYLDLETEHLLSADAEALVDHLDELLTWGTLSPATRQAVISAINSMETAVDKVEAAVHLIIESPDFVVLK